VFSARFVKVGEHVAKYEEQQKEDLLRAALSGGGDANSCTPQQQHQHNDQEIKIGKKKRSRPPYDLLARPRGLALALPRKSLRAPSLVDVQAAVRRTWKLATWLFSVT